MGGKRARKPTDRYGYGVAGAVDDGGAAELDGEPDPASGAQSKAGKLRGRKLQRLVHEPAAAVDADATEGEQTGAVAPTGKDGLQPSPSSAAATDSKGGRKSASAKRRKLAVAAGGETDATGDAALDGAASAPAPPSPALTEEQAAAVSEERALMAELGHDMGLEFLPLSERLAKAAGPIAAAAHASAAAVVAFELQHAASDAVSSAAGAALSVDPDDEAGSGRRPRRKAAQVAAAATKAAAAASDDRLNDDDGAAASLCVSASVLPAASPGRGKAKRPRSAAALLAQVTAAGMGGFVPPPLAGDAPAAAIAHKKPAKRARFADSAVNDDEDAEGSRGASSVASAGGAPPFASPGSVASRVSSAPSSGARSGASSGDDCEDGDDDADGGAPAARRLTAREVVLQAAGRQGTIRRAQFEREMLENAALGRLLPGAAGGAGASVGASAGIDLMRAVADVGALTSAAGLPAASSGAGTATLAAAPAADIFAGRGARPQASSAAGTAGGGLGSLDLSDAFDDEDSDSGLQAAGSPLSSMPAGLASGGGDIFARSHAARGAAEGYLHDMLHRGRGGGVIQLDAGLMTRLQGRPEAPPTAPGAARKVAGKRSGAGGSRLKATGSARIGSAAEMAAAVSGIRTKRAAFALLGAAGLGVQLDAMMSPGGTVRMRARTEDGDDGDEVDDEGGDDGGDDEEGEHELI